MSLDANVQSMHAAPASPARKYETTRHEPRVNEYGVTERGMPLKLWREMQSRDRSYDLARPEGFTHDFYVGV